MTEFKEVLMELPALESSTKNITPEHLRVRIQQHAGFFGPILRAGDPKAKNYKEPTLKSLKVKDRYSIVV